MFSKMTIAGWPSIGSFNLIACSNFPLCLTEAQKTREAELWPSTKVEGATALRNTAVARKQHMLEQLTAWFSLAANKN